MHNMHWFDEKHVGHNNLYTGQIFKAQLRVFASIYYSI